jgi:hypothetical protein
MGTRMGVLLHWSAISSSSWEQVDTSCLSGRKAPLLMQQQPDCQDGIDHGCRRSNKHLNGPQCMQPANAASNAQAMQPTWSHSPCSSYCWWQLCLRNIMPGEGHQPRSKRVQAFVLSQVHALPRVIVLQCTAHVHVGKMAMAMGAVQSRVTQRRCHYVVTWCELQHVHSCPTTVGSTRTGCRSVRIHRHMSLAELLGPCWQRCTQDCFG